MLDLDEFGLCGASITLPIGDCRLEIGDCQLQIADCQLEILEFRLKIDLQLKSTHALGNRQSAIGNRQSSIGNHQSAIINRQSAIGNQQSAISNRQSLNLGESMSNSLLQSRMKNLLLFVPNLVLLCGRLMVDPRVPAKERILVAGAVVYALMPFDLIPDLLPFVGQIDDAYLVALSLLRLATVTDPQVVREHWRGGGDVVELIGATAMIASKLLPKRIRRVLTAHVESTGVEKNLRSPVLVERSRIEVDKEMSTM